MAMAMTIPLNIMFWSFLPEQHWKLLIFLARSRFNIFYFISFRWNSLNLTPLFWSCILHRTNKTSWQSVSLVFALFLCSHYYGNSRCLVCALTVIQGIIFSLIEITLINNRSKTMHFQQSDCNRLHIFYLYTNSMKKNCRNRFVREIVAEKKRDSNRQHWVVCSRSANVFMRLSHLRLSR